MKKSFEKSENFYQESLFTFNSYKSYCAIDTINIEIGEVKKIFKVNSLTSEPIKFAFQPKDGLVRVSLKNGSVEESNILSSLLSIKDNNIENYRKFFEKNGFFYPLKGDKYVEIDDNSLLLIVGRMKATVELMSQISEVQRKNYDRILTLTLALLLKPQIEIKIGDHVYKTSKHEKLSNELLIASNIADNSFNFKTDENYVFTIKDSIYGHSKMHLDVYRNLKTDELILDNFWRKVLHSYVNHEDSDKDVRLMIEVLYHVYFNIGNFSSCSFEKINFSEKPKWDNFDDPLKRALLEVAKIVVAEEINSSLHGIFPEYDSSIMEPRWRVDSLISALYFSIFYMKPNIELTRICANPRCGNYFTISRTSSKKKYCSPQCANRAIQNRYRAKKKSAEK